MNHVTCVVLLLVSAISVVVSKELSLLYKLEITVDTEEPIERAFQAFKLKFNKTYEDARKDKLRLLIFDDNVQYIKDHNLLYDKGEKSYTLGVNEFSDLTHVEFLQLYTSRIRPSELTNSSVFEPSYNAPLPSSVDWRTKNVVTPVKNQGQCGSCWSFSTTGSIEGQHAKKKGGDTPLSLSEQQLIDCDNKDSGCNGGLPTYAFEYVMRAGGITTEGKYPYTARKGYCKFDTSMAQVKVTGFKKVYRTETDLQKAVAELGPISVGIDANHRSFQSYQKGVYDEPSCTTNLDHAVLAVGYGTEQGKDYWLVKNSWGTSWGMKGYIMMSRNKHNQCGIANMASCPITS